MYVIDLFEDAEDTGAPAEYQPAGPHVPGARNRALANANITLLMKSINSPGYPPVTISFLNGTSRALRPDEIKDIADYYETLKTKVERANFIYRTLVSQNKMNELLARMKQSQLDFNAPAQEPVATKPEPQQLDLFKESQKKSSKKDKELTGHTAKDTTVARELQKLRARHPAAKSDIEALIKDEILSSEKTSKDQADQDSKIDQLSKQTTDLQTTVQNMQAANSRLQDILSKMSGRKPKSEPGVSVATDKIPAVKPEPGTTVIATEPVKKPTAQPAPIPGTTVSEPTRLPEPEEQPSTVLQVPSRQEEPIATTTIGDEPAEVLPRDSIKSADIINFGSLRKPADDADNPQKAAECHDIGSGQVGAILESQEEFVFYINGKPAAKYQNEADALRDMDLIKKKYPDAILDLKQEICDLETIRHIAEGSSILEALPAKAAKELYRWKNQQNQPQQEPVITKPAEPQPQPARLSDLQSKRQKVANLADIKKTIETLQARATRGGRMLPRGLAADLEDYFTTADIDRDYEEMLAKYQKQLGALQQYLGMRKVLWSPKKDVHEDTKSELYANAIEKIKKLLANPKLDPAVRKEYEARLQKFVHEGTMKQASKHPTGPKFGGYWKGTDKNPPKPGQSFGGLEEGRAGYNPLTSQQHWQEVKNHLTKLLASDMPYADKQVVRQRYLEKQKEAQQKGWEK